VRNIRHGDICSVDRAWVFNTAKRRGYAADCPAFRIREKTIVFIVRANPPPLPCVVWADDSLMYAWSFDMTLVRGG